MPAPEDLPLRLEPFRGVRYRDGIDLAAVTAPPYDVLDAASVRDLTAAEPHNLVRLLLPEGDDAAQRRSAARQTLDRWLADGTLRPDPQAALYVYEEADADGVGLRGVIGALRLPPEGSQVVLPHEDVMDPVVADRAGLQGSLEAQVEPIWLLYGGGGPASDVVDAAAEEPPLEECVTADGTRHRLWAVTDPLRLAAVSEDLAARHAMIADGHHRYAAYQAVQDAAHRSGGGDGPWDLGLALLVDTTTHAPRVTAIHRVVRGLEASAATLPGAPAPDSRPAEDWRPALEGLRPGRLLVVTADGAARPLELPAGPARHALFDGTPGGAAMPPAWQDLDAAVLHEVLLPAWGVPDAAVSYHHTAEAAVAEAARDGAVALLMAPVAVETVLELAAAGIRMPRKSTSFGPKPRGGFVLRSFRW